MAQGNATGATRYLEHAANDVPGFRLAVLMQELINRGTIAEVARNVEASYKRRMI